MRRRIAILSILCLSIGVVFAQKRAADPEQRYYRLICLLHLTGSGRNGDPVLPEYVAAGTALAQTAVLAAAKGAAVNLPAAAANGAGSAPVTATPAAAPVATVLSSRPGFLSWSMQTTDDGKMAIVHIVAADPSAFSAILADKRQDIRVFQIGKDSKATIEAEMQKHKKGFSLDSFEVMAQ